MTAPGAPGAPAPGSSNKATLFGVLGIIVGLICCGPAGIVLGILSLNQAKKYGTSPTLAWVAIIASIVGMIWSGFYFTTQL